MSITILANSEPRQHSLKEIFSELVEYPSFENCGVAKAVAHINQRSKIPLLDILLKKEELIGAINWINVLESKFKTYRSEVLERIKPHKSILDEVQKEIKDSTAEGKAFRVLQTVLLITYLAGSILFGAKLVFAGSLALGASILVGGLVSYLFAVSYLSRKPAQEMLRIENYLTRVGLDEKTGLPLPRKLFNCLGVLPLLEAFSKANRLKVVESRVIDKIKENLNEIETREQEKEKIQVPLIGTIQKFFEGHDMVPELGKIEEALSYIEYEIKEIEASRELFAAVLVDKNIEEKRGELLEKIGFVSSMAKELGLPATAPGERLDSDGVRFFDDLAGKIFSHYQGAHTFMKELDELINPSDSSESSESEWSGATSSEDESEISEAESDIEILETLKDIFEKPKKA